MYRTQVADSGSESDSSENEERNWKRPTNRHESAVDDVPPPVQEQQTKRNPKFKTGAALRRLPRRPNRIWGDVVQEQVLMENMGSGFAVEGLPVDGEDRGVESYNFTKAFSDPRPPVEPIQIEGVPKALEKIRREEEEARARRIRDRLGVPERVKKISPTAAVDDIVEAICKRLDEPKVGLIERVVNIVGKERSLELLYATENIEANGGLMINSGSRRRTAGGVYLHLLRSDTRISSDDMANIFAPDQAEYKEVQRKRKRSELEKKAYRTIRKLEESILGEASSSSSTSSDEDNSRDLKLKRAKLAAMDEDSTVGEGPQGNSNKAEADKRASDLEEGEIDDD